MKTKNLVLSSLLLGIGTLLHFITPPIFFGIKPDFLLVMTFICIFVARDLQSTLIISLSAGFIAALTTNFPMGQIPNILDKLVTGFIVYYIYKFQNFNMNPFKIALISAFATLISGLIFLYTGLLIINQMEMFITSLPVVLITMPINAVIATIVYKSMALSMRKIR